jgi:hypothetical protein
MMSSEDPQYTRLIRGIGEVGLNGKWALSVAALCAQELAIKKRLESFGIETEEQDFQKLAKALIDALRQEGEEPPEILMSLVRAHPYLRAKLVHSGHKASLRDEDVNSLVTNTVDLVAALFGSTTKTVSEREAAERLLRLASVESVTRRIGVMRAEQKRGVVLVLVQIRAEILANWESAPDARKKETKCRTLAKQVILSMKAEEIAELVNEIIILFSLTQPSLVMEVLSYTSHLQPVVSMVKDKNHLSWILTSFIRSNSYEEATTNSIVLVNIANLLSRQELESVLGAVLSNGQITYSYGAQSKLRPLIAWAVGKVDDKLLREVSAGFPPT